MPTRKDAKTSVDLSAIIEGLLTSSVDFILVGGLAAVVQGAPVTTMDVDIVHEQSPGNISRLFTYLTSIDALYRRPDEKTIAPKKEDLLGSGHLLLTTRKGPLDVLGVIEEGKTYEDLLPHTIEIEFRGRKLRILDLRMLTELKRASRLPKDRHKLAILEETLRQLTKKKTDESP